MFNAQPSRCRQFRQTRVLIVGCGDVGLRAAKALLPRCRVLALTSSSSRVPALRAQGIVPLLGNLDAPATLSRLAGLADHVLHLAPPPGQGKQDPRTQVLLQALARRSGARSLVYGSTTGVYGDAQGERFDETRAVNPTTDRGQRRVDAEAWVRQWARQMALSHRTRASVLRIPGIYAAGREGGDPRERVRRCAPVLCPEDDVFTNHIHADDLVRVCVLAMWRARPLRVFHVCDDTEMKMGDYFDRVADMAGLSRPPRISRAEAQTTLSPMQMSFMSESRRLSNGRMKHELRLRLKHPLAPVLD
jgi:nucleoside-diphosphate-sugar epimerase